MHPTLATSAILAAAGLVATTSFGVAVSPRPAVRAAPPDRFVIPEYAPVAEVIMSEDLFNYGYDAPLLARAVLEAGATPVIAVNNRKTAKTLRRALAAGEAGRSGLTAAEVAKLGFARVPHASIWMRDYGPVMVGETRPGRRDTLVFADLVYGSSEKDNERFPAALARALGRPHDGVALELDGGNLLAARDVCFTSTTEPGIGTYDAVSGGAVGLRPARAPGGATPPDALVSGPRALAERFGSELGCKTVVVIAKPPHAHVDMWMKVVGDDAVLVNELDETTIAAVKERYGYVPEDVAALRDDLNDKARELSKYLKVDRVPMPLPYRGAFRTYTNALLVNGTAIVPSYARFGWNYDDYPDAKLRAHYEDAARAAYARHGFRARLVNADGLIHNGGAFHCVMLQIPRLAPHNPVSRASFQAKGH